MPWLDLLVCLVIIVFALSGFFRGFWRNFISLFSSLVVIVLAVLLAKPISNLLEMWFGTTSALAGSLQGGFADYFASTDYHSGWIYALLLAFMGKPYMDGDPAADVLAADFSVRVSKLLMVVICAIVVFFLIKLVLWLILKFVKKLNLNPVHNAIDRTFGVVLGIGKGFFCIMTASWIVFSLGGVITAIAGWFDSMFATNQVAKALYDASVYIMQNLILPFIFR